MRIDAVSRLPGVTVANRSESECPSARLVQDFVYYTADLAVEVAAELAGVSTATLTRWRMMGARQLRADVRRRLLVFVTAKEGKSPMPVAA
jgi:hypothetical protein